METNGNTTWINTPAGKHLNESLSNERVLQGIDHLLQRIDTLENAVEKLTTVMDQGPGMVSMVTDMADEAYKKAADRGVDIEERLGNALVLAEKLTAPAMMEKLEGLLQFADQAPGLISMTMDMVDEGVRKSAENGVYLEERLGNALTMAEKLTAPAMVEKLNGLLTLADQAPGLISMMVDSFDEQMRSMDAGSMDVQGLMEIGKEATSAFTKAKEMPIAKVGGIFSMLRTMRDPDRQKAIGFLMNVAKAYGEQLNGKV